MGDDKKEKEILLNIMYSGTYLDTGNNIGHEVINLLKDDNRNNYIYVLPYGTVGNDYVKKIETILLVKRCNSKIMEILAKAEGLTYIKTSPKGKEKDLQKDYINKNNIRYGGIKLPEIYTDNTENGNYVTFKAKKVIKVAKPIFITTNTETDIEDCSTLENDKNFPRQKQITYISSKTPAYATLKTLIDDDTYWGEETKTYKKYKKAMEDKYRFRQYNFIKLIRQNYNELVFSNLFEYIFSSDLEGLNLFVQDVLGLKDVKFAKMPKIEREKENIDLLIHDENSVIVIENKIKSHINGICKSAEEDEKIKSQLLKYFEYVNDEKNFSQKHKKYYFVIAPNYNQINLGKYVQVDNYKLVKYSEIYKFFNDKKELYKDKNVKYFDEFLYALSLHTSEVDNRNEEEMFERFFNIIQAKQKEKKSKICKKAN